MESITEELIMDDDDDADTFDEEWNGAFAVPVRDLMWNMAQWLEGEPGPVTQKTILDEFTNEEAGFTPALVSVAYWMLRETGTKLNPPA